MSWSWGKRPRGESRDRGKAQGQGAGEEAGVASPEQHRARPAACSVRVTAQATWTQSMPGRAELLYRDGPQIPAGPLTMAVCLSEPPSLPEL